LSLLGESLSSGALSCTPCRQAASQPAYDAAIRLLRTTTVVVFSHGHVLRVLAARWLGLPAGAARYFVLSTAALSILGYEHTRDEPALRLWNDDRHVLEEPREPMKERGTR
jgi:broad specificity phosphatase PhoE